MADYGSSLVWIHDPDSPQVVAALGWSCDVCKAREGKCCTNTITPGPLAGRVVHFARLVDRRRERKDDE